MGDRKGRALRVGVFIFIKLRASGYRLVYEVDDDVVVLLVIVVDKHEREAVYRKLRRRLE